MELSLYLIGFFKTINRVFVVLSVEFYFFLIFFILNLGR
jgi:hypothetical protein